MDKNKCSSITDKIKQNNLEDITYKEQYERYLTGKMRSNEFINAGSNPNVIIALHHFGINSRAKIIKLNQSDLKNALSIAGKRTKKHTDGHSIPPEELYNLSKELRVPIMVLKGHIKNPDSIVLITEMKSAEGNNVFVPISLNRESGEVNRITTIFSKKNIINYIQNNINNILAINIKKADKLLTDKEFQSLKSSVICFDDSIAYTLDNVNYPF